MQKPTDDLSGRLKIKCSGAATSGSPDTARFPCESCVKRGVSSVCPNGVVPERQRKKADSAEGDILRRRNQVLATRVRELEAELAKLTGTSPQTSESTQDDEFAHTPGREPGDHKLVESFGTLTIEESGTTTWHGPYAPSINLLPSDDPPDAEPIPEKFFDTSLPRELSILIAGFPFTNPVIAVGAMKDTIRSFAPSYPDAVKFCENFFQNAAWLGSPCTKERFFNTILMPLYASKSWATERADDMALFFSICAMGCMFDLSRPLYDPMAFLLNKMTAGSLALAAPIEHPTMTSLEALQSHLFFHQLSDRPIALSRFWVLSAVAFRMAQALGLHRDSRAWGLDSDVEQRRRWLFWQLNFMDAVIAAGYGRPRYFNPHHYDCPLPDPSWRPDLKGMANWRFEFLRDALIPVMEDAFAVHPPPTYGTIMRLDKKVRALPVPNIPALALDLMTMSASDCMQLFCVGGMKQLALLYLHRRFFFEAASDEASSDILKHKYEYSVRATYATSISIIRQVRGLFFKDKAFIVLATLVIKRPACDLAENALMEMNSILSIFEQAQESRRVKRCLPAMTMLRDKAQTILSLNRTGHSFRPPLDSQLENLLSGSPVIVKTGSTCRMEPEPPKVPEIRQDLEVDLQALFGTDSVPFDFGTTASPLIVNQPVDPMSFQWTPLNASTAEVSSNMGDIFGFLQPPPSKPLNPEASIDWEALMRGYSYSGSAVALLPHVHLSPLAAIATALGQMSSPVAEYEALDSICLPEHGFHAFDSLFCSLTGAQPVPPAFKDEK
ncbi:hypothetical protein FRC17_008243 [Serendipita sp. 399]|nr:hypothetical protein FRC17_008243 [Serendipita sp. 399]